MALLEICTANFPYHLAGFTPPTGKDSKLKEWEYDANYVDAYGRRPGEAGFVPPSAARQGKTAEDMMAQYPHGYDENYRDASGKRPGESGFVPPKPRPGLGGKPDDSYMDSVGRLHLGRVTPAQLPGGELCRQHCGQNVFRGQGKL